MYSLNSFNVYIPFTKSVVFLVIYINVYYLSSIVTLHAFFVFSCNAKSFAIAFFFLFISTANLDALRKVACQIFYIC